MSRLHKRTNTGPRRAAYTVESDTIRYSGVTLEGISTKTGDTMTKVIQNIDFYVGSTVDAKLNNISTSGVTKYNGTTSFTSNAYTFTIPSGTLNSVLKSLGDQIAVEGEKISDITPSSINETRTPVNYNPSGSDTTKLDAHIAGIDTKLGTLTTDVLTNTTYGVTTTADAQKSEEHSASSAVYGNGWVKTIGADSYSGSSLDLTVPVVTAAYVKGYRVSTSATSTVTLTANRDNYVYLNKDGGWGNIAMATDASESTLKATSSYMDVLDTAIYIYKAVTNGSGVTSVTDLHATAPIGAGSISNNSVTTASIADDAVTAAKLANTSVTAGTYNIPNITVDAQGRLTGAASNFNITSVANNDQLIYNTSTSKWINQPGIPTNTSSLKNGDVLKYNSGTSKFENVTIDGGILPAGTSNHVLHHNGAAWTSNFITTSSITDFTISSAAYGDVMEYDATATVWKNVNGLLKLSYTHADLTTAGTSQAFTQEMPAGSIVEYVKVKHSTPFTGGSLSTFTITVNDGSAIVNGINIFQSAGAAVGAIATGTRSATTIPDHGSTWNITITFTGSHNVNTATAGAVDVWIKYRQLI